MANNDFFVNFDSNAKSFAARLKSELQPAREEIIALGRLLQGLEQQASKSTPAVTAALARTLPPEGHTGGSGGGSSAASLEKVREASEDFRRELGDLAKELKTVVAGIKASTDAQGRVNRGNGAWVHPDTGAILGNRALGITNAQAAASTPGAYRMGTLPVDPALNRVIGQLASAATSGRLAAGSNLAHPASVRIADVGKVQLDQAAFDRVVKAVNEVRDEVRNLGTRPQGNGAEPAPTASRAPARPATPAAKPAASTASETQSDEARLAVLKRDVASLKVSAQELTAVIAQAGGALDESFTKMAADVEQKLNQSQAALAKMERETTGITKGEQSARNKAEYQRGPDLPEDEFNRRRQMRQRLDLALSPDTFMGEIGTGKGKLRKDDLIGMAKQLTEMGFATPSSKKLTSEQLGQGIVSGRQAMLAHYGADVPAELQTGRKIVADKVSDAVTKILEDANISAADAAEEFAAREAIRTARMAGHVPKNPTLRATQITGEGATSLAGQRLSGAIGVPPGMVKGGEYNDVFGMLPAAELIKQRAMGRAANLAMRPDYDPFRVNLKQEITGHGEEAETKRTAFRALRQATNDLDELGTEYNTFAEAIKQNEEFIGRATARLESGTPKVDDAQQIEAARRNIAQKSGLMESDHFRGLQDVFESPDYQAGRRAREISRAQYQAQIEDASRREHQTFIGDAAGYAIAGSRLAPGTKDTYIQGVPGMAYRGRQNQFAFRDPDKDPGQLKDLNQAWRALTGTSGQTGLIAHERGIAKDVAAGDRPQADLDKARRKVEGKATVFLNQMAEIFGTAPSLESLIARAPMGRGSGPVNPITGEAPALNAQQWAQRGITGLRGPSSELPTERYSWVKPENEAGDARRQRDVLDAQRAEKASIAQSKGTDDEKATASLAEAKHRLAAALEEQAKQAEDLAKLEAELEKTYGALSKSDQELVAASDARLKRLEAERNKLENAWHPRVDKHGEALAEPDPNAGEGVRQNVERQRAEVAALVRKERSQRGAMTRLDKVVEAGGEAAHTTAFYAKYEAAEKRLAATTEKLATEREQLVRLEGQMGAKVAAAEAGSRNAATLSNQYRDRGHHPGEPLDVMGYPSRFGYNADAETRKKQLDAQIEQARSDRSKVAGGGDRAALVDELERLKAGRQGIVSKISAARDEGDLKENAGYHAAKDEQGRAEARIKQIEAQLSSTGVEKYEQLAREFDATNKVIAHLTEQVAKAEERLVKAGAKGRAANAPNAADRPQADTAEAHDLRERISIAQGIQRKMTELRAAKKVAADADKAAIQAQIDELKKAPGFVQRNDISTMRKQLAALNQAAGGSGGAGAGGTRGTGGAASSGGGNGSEGPVVSVLREILAAVNGVDRTLRTGVRVSGGGTARAVGEDGKPVSRKKVADYSVRPAGEAEAAAGADNEAAALAGAAEERRIQELNKNTNLRQKVLNAARREAIAYARTEEEQARRSEMLSASQAHAELQLAQAMGLVGSAAKHELAELARLNQEGVTGIRLAEQQARAYTAVNRSMAAKNVEGGDRRAHGRTLLNAQGGEEITGPFYDTIARSARGGAGAGPKQAQSALAAALFGDTGFWSRVTHSTGTFLVRNFTAGFVFGLTNALQQVVQQAIITEQTFVRVSNALDATGKHVGGLRSDLQKISTDYGTSLNDVYDVAAGLVGLFKSPVQIASATRVVAQLETISDGALNAQEAMGVLGSITSSYSDQLGTSAEGFTHVADVLTTIQNVIGTNVEVTAEGVASLSGLAKQLHLSFEQTAVLTAQIAKQTNQTGAAAGEQFGRILGSLQTGRGQGAVTKAFTEAGNAGKIDKNQTAALTSAFQSADYGSVLNILMKNWDNLSKSQQRNIAVQVAGQRQMRAFAALMGNTKANLQDIDRATYESGSAQDRMNKIMHQLNGQIRILGANFQNLANNLVRSGILDAVAGSLRLVNLALGGINDVLTKLNDFVDSNAATRMLKHLTFGILGLVTALKLLAIAKRGIGGAIASRLGTDIVADGESLISGGKAGGLTRGASRGSSGGMLASLLGARRAAGAVDDVEKVRLAERLRTRATTLRDVAAQAAASQSLQGGRFLRRGEVMGPWGSPFARGAAGRGASALEATSRVGARTLETSAAALDGLTSSAGALAGPAAIAGVGLLALVDNISRTGKVAAENAELVKEFNKRFGLEDKPGEGDKTKSEWQKFGGKASATWRATGDYVGEFSRDVVHPSQWGKLIMGGVQGVAKRGIARDKGTYENDLNQGYGVADAQKLLNSGTKTLDHVSGGPKALLQAQKDFNKRLGKAKDEIVNNSSISAGQKNQAIKALEQAGIAFADQTNILILKAKGLGKADALTTAQINSANSAIQTMAQLGGASSVGGVDLSPLYDSLKTEVGADKNSELSGLLDQMSNGTADDLTMGLDTRKVLQDLLTQTQSKLQTMDPSNDDYAGLQQLAGQLGQQLLNSTQTLLDTLNTNAQTAAGVLAKRGNYGAAAGEFDQGIAQAKADLAAAQGPPASLLKPGAVQGLMRPTEGQKKKKIAGIEASMDTMYQQQTDFLLEEKLKDLKAQLAVADPKLAKIIQAEIDRVTADFYKQRGADVPGSVTPEQQNAANQAVTNDREAARADRLARRQAAVQTRATAAGPGNAMAAARGQLAVARLAQQDALRFGKASVEYQTATQQVIAAQYSIISAEGDIAQANASLRAAYANARGDTVGAAKAGLQAAKAGLAYARRLSGGARSAEVINAQAQVVSARASIRDARLQDELDTIDFNLQMGKITQSSAISALRDILRTHNLTKQQRRQLMLQIKGMEKEISDSPWNFGDIKLPKPYLMRRYIEEQRASNTKRLDAMVGGSLRTSTAVSSAVGAAQQQYTDNRNVEILINGGNLDQIRKVLREIVGTPTRTRTTAPRRGRR